MANNKILDEIEDWKLEAKLEDNIRYFYHTKIVDKITSGKKLYVIGRKGTGKTAITEYLISTKRRGYFAQKLTFKNFPFNKFYELEDKGFNAPNQYITLWKYVIYSATCRLMINNDAIDIETRDKLREIFSDDISNALPSAIERWTGYKFDLKILGSGLSLENKKEIVPNEHSWIDRVVVLEKFLQGHLGNQEYLIIFDELDEDYKDIIEPQKHKRYTELLTGLFKAVQDIRSKFLKWKYYPVIFLRDDIYEILEDPDKTKWSDYEVALEWNRDSIQNMLAFRISRAISANGEILDFNRAWQKVFEGGQIKYGSGKTMSAFDYIVRSSLMRPRDFIKYIQICAATSNEKSHVKIKSKTVADSDTAFSNHLRSELRDEIQGIIPDIGKVLDLFSLLRKQTLRIEEFKNLYDQAVAEGKVSTKDYQFVLQILFHFSVIGNQPNQKNHQVFKYELKDAQLNMKENLIIHRGLFRSLQIL